ncbi:MAG: sigma-70 family RNA polymerase sigma factor [Acidimicrobiales bacterium]
MALRKENPVDPEQLDDAELARRASEGDAASFEVLYLRHAEAAWRMAQAITPNPEDAADAVADAFTNLLAALAAGRLDPGIPFRPYLLVAARNAAIDQHRRRSRLRPEGDGLVAEYPSSDPGPSERVEAAADAGLLCDAFRSLPERWRTVLWMTEVEGIPAREVGARLGLTPNSAAQLTRRAREGLRDRFLQAHLSRTIRPACADTVPVLGAFTSGSLSPKASARVELHLATCPDCRQRADELSDIGRSLRALPLPIPIGLGAGVLTSYRLHFKSGSLARVSIQSGERITRAMAVSTAVLLALGVTTAGLMSGGNGPTAVPGGRSGGSIAAPGATRLSQIPDEPIGGSGNTTGSPQTPGPLSTSSTTGGAPGDTPGPQPPSGDSNPPAPTTPPKRTNPTPTPPSGPQLGVVAAANLGVATASASLNLTGGCTGLSLNGSTSCAPKAPSSTGVSLGISTPLGTVKSGPAVHK